MRRSLLILFAYCCAALIACDAGIILDIVRDSDLRDSSVLRILVSPYVFVGSILVGCLVAIPAGIFIGLAEIAGFRRWYYYVLGGALSGVLVFGGNERWPQLPPKHYVLLHNDLVFFSLCGAIGGLTFWLVARRRAEEIR